MVYDVNGRFDNPATRTIQTAVLIETLVALGAQVTWSSCVWFDALSANRFYSYSLRTFSLLKTMQQPRM